MPIQSQVRPASITELWPIALALSVVDKFTSSPAATEGSEEDEEEELDTDSAAGKKANRKANKKSRSLQKRGVNGKN